jgi:hypothetical protein
VSQTSDQPSSSPADAPAVTFSGASHRRGGHATTVSPAALPNPTGRVRSFPAGRVYSRPAPGCLLRLGLFFCGAAVAMLVLAFCCGCLSDYQRVPAPLAADSPDVSYLPGLDHRAPTYQPSTDGGALRQVNPGARDQRDYAAENRQWLAVRGRWFLVIGAALGAIGGGLALATQNPVLDFVANIAGYIGLAGCGAGLAFMQLAQWWVWFSIGFLALLAGTVAYRLWRHRRQRSRRAIANA